jgi:desulfoferrodoxin-like iron-binding protein
MRGMLYFFAGATLSSHTSFSPLKYRLHLILFFHSVSYGWHYSLAAPDVFHIRRLTGHIFKIGKEEKMAQKGEVYKCDVCGNVVSVVIGGDGDLVCCGENMRQLSQEEVSKL